MIQRCYTYDTLGRPLTRDTQYPGKGITHNDSFAHNSRSELVSAQVNDEVYTYSYDNIGNRESAQEAAEDATQYASNELNQYTSVGTFTPEFDPSGNQTLVKTSTGIWRITYNAENRPTRFESEDGSTVVQCAYDYLGRRATKKITTNGNVTLHQRYIYRGYLQIAACDLTRAASPSLWLILWDPTQPMATRPLAIQKDGIWYAYGWDITKNICEIYGQTGYIRTLYTYSPYGSVSADGDVSQHIQWSSEVYDEELGMPYYNYRNYNCKEGRWCNIDLISNKYSHNQYIFVHNSPADIYDVLGEKYSVDASNCLGYALSGRSAYLEPDQGQSMKDFVSFYVKNCKKVCKSSECTPSKTDTKVLIIFYTGNYEGDPWSTPQNWGPNCDFHGMRSVADSGIWTNIPRFFPYRVRPIVANPSVYDGNVMYCCTAKKENRKDNY